MIIKSGGRIVPETRFPDSEGVTRAMRLKEKSEEYKFVADFDIPSVSFYEQVVSCISIPDLPDVVKARICKGTYIYLMITIIKHT